MKYVIKDTLACDGFQPPTFLRCRAAIGPSQATLFRLRQGFGGQGRLKAKHKTLFRALRSIALPVGLFALAAGCGTSSNLAGLGVSVNVAQKGVIAAASFNAGTNAVTFGGSYASGTNVVSGTVSIPNH